ncbi:MAG: amidohydrolase [Rhodospirillales bacterium]
MTRPCPGPKPPLRPRLVAPPGACDTHAHVLGPYARFPLNEDRSYTAPEAPFADYATLLDTLGLERGVIVHGSAHGTMMDASLDAIARLGKRGRGVAVVEPTTDDRALDRLHEAGIRGVRVTTVLRGGISPDHMMTLAGRLKRLGWHIQVFIDGPRQMTDYLAMLRSLPVDIVIDHMGYFRPEDGIDHPGFRGLLDLVHGGRCWVKLSGAYRHSLTGAPFADMTPFAQALIEARPDRMVWGSDWPHVMLWDRPMPQTADILDWALTWQVDDATLRRILVDNPAALYDFG